MFIYDIGRGVVAEKHEIKKVKKKIFKIVDLNLISTTANECLLMRD